MKKIFKKIKDWFITNNLYIVGIALIIVACIIVSAIGILVMAKFI